MTTATMHIGMKVKHSEYGLGSVKGLSEHVADIRFDSGLRTLAPEQCNLEPADAQTEITGLNIPLSTVISETVNAMVEKLDLKQDDAHVEQLAHRWQSGTLVLRPADASLQAKEVPLETFFHKIVMMRNNFRVLEQKINGHPQLADADKVEMQQYISKCYGSMTTFNILFKNEGDQFRSKG
ncbi:MAG: hypothetical protein ABIV39_18720 [Verrucomicrobiota bacterium]